MRVVAVLIVFLLAAVFMRAPGYGESSTQFLNNACPVFGTVEQMEADAKRMPPTSKKRSDELKEAAHQMNECIPDIKGRELRDFAHIYHSQLVWESVRTVGDALNYLPIAMAEIDPVFRSRDRSDLLSWAHIVKNGEAAMFSTAQQQMLAALRALPTPAPQAPSYSAPSYAPPPPAEDADCDSDSIDDVARDGKVITTLSGDTFLVPDVDTVTTSLWLSASDIEVCSTANPRVFMLINKDDDNEHVYATKVSE